MAKLLTPVSALENFLRQSSIVQHLLRICQEENLNLYIFGGFLRDFLYSGKLTNDIDFYIECDYETVMRIRERFRQEYLHFLKSTTLPKEAINPDYVDIIHCKKVTEQIYNSDFTVNALIYDFQQKKVLDPTNGLKDLQQGLMRLNSLSFYLANGSAFIRLFRQAAQLQFTIDEGALEATRQYAHLIGMSDPYKASRNISELFKFFLRRRINREFDLMAETGLFQYIFPEIAPALTCPSPLVPSLSCFDYNKAVFKRVEDLWESFPENVRQYFSAIEKMESDITQKVSRVDLVPTSNLLALVRMACLFYDLGSPFIQLDPKLPESYKTDAFSEETTRKLIFNMASRFCYIDFNFKRLMECSIVCTNTKKWLQEILNGNLGVITETPDLNLNSVLPKDKADDLTLKAELQQRLYALILLTLVMHLSTLETLKPEVSHQTVIQELIRRLEQIVQSAPVLTRS